MEYIRRLTASVRQPEYTGDNRCVPCTVLNLVIALGLGSGIGVGTTMFVPGQLSIIVAVGSMLAFAGIIYLRGYLIPGTPTLTKRYFPDRVLRLFDEQPATGSVDRTETEQVDVEAMLLAAGAITERDDRDDHCLTPAFQAAWENRIRAIRDTDVDRRELARVHGVEETTVTFIDRSRSLVASINGREAGQWVSRAALIADLAADRVFSNSLDGWTDLDVDKRGQVLSALRIFIESCPACDGRVVLGNDTVESCCRSIDVIAATCEECGVRVFELTDS